MKTMNLLISTSEGFCAFENFATRKFERRKNREREIRTIDKRNSVGAVLEEAEEFKNWNAC